MLSKSDLEKIKQIVKPIEEKIDRVASDVKDLKLETKGIHLILERQEKDFGERIERLEQNAEPN